MSERAQIKTAADFGFQLREERERRGITQAELAVLADVSIRWLSNFERGKSPRAELIKVMHVARALGMAFELVEERERKISPSHQALVDAFTYGPQAPQVTPELANALAQMSQKASDPAIIANAIVAINTVQHALQQNNPQLSPAILKKLVSLGADIDSREVLPDSSEAEDQDGEA